VTCQEMAKLKDLKDCSKSVQAFSSIFSKLMDEVILHLSVEDQTDLHLKLQYLCPHT
jgi:hypothetical protein